MKQENFDLLALVNAVRGQTVESPPPYVRSQVMAEISPTRPANPVLRWAFAAPLGLLIFAILWSIVQPGIVLRWVWPHGDVNVFQIYRAPHDSNQFIYLQEIQTQKSLTEYTLIDPLLVPGQAYTYHIVGIDAEGHSIFNQTVSENAMAALPGQIALLITSLVTATALLPGLERIDFSNLLKSKVAVV